MITLSDWSDTVLTNPIVFLLLKKKLTPTSAGTSPHAPPFQPPTLLRCRRTPCRTPFPGHPPMPHALPTTDATRPHPAHLRRRRRTLPPCPPTSPTSYNTPLSRSLDLDCGTASELRRIDLEHRASPIPRLGACLRLAVVSERRAAQLPPTSKSSWRAALCLSRGRSPSAQPPPRSPHEGSLLSSNQLSPSCKTADQLTIPYA